MGDKHMKLRKLFAWLLTLVMLLGMVPTAQAEVINCDHNWAWRWPNGQPANCQDWKWSEEYCTICGVGNGGFEQCGPCQPGSKTWIRPQGSNCQEYGVWEITCKYCGEWLEGREEPGPHKWTTQTTREPGCETPGYKEILCSVCGSEQGAPEEIPALGHNWGSWRWAHGEPPCNSNGAWQVRDCQRCGTQEDRWVEGGSHAFGPWHTTQEPTCMAPGRQEHTCTRCGYTEWGFLPQLEHVFGEWYVISEAQIGLPGLEQRDCTYGCGTFEQREIPALEQDFGGDEVLPTVTFEKVILSTPANGEYYTAGEEITYCLEFDSRIGDFSWGDEGDYPVFNVRLYDPLYSESAPVFTTTYSWDISMPFVYYVTEEDAQRGYVTNTAYATFSYTEGGATVRIDSNTVTAPCGPGELSDDYVPPVNPDIDEDVIPNEEAPDYKPAAGLTVAMTYTNTPANGSFFTPGEAIDYLITVTNTGDVPLTDLFVGNSSSEAVVPAPSEIAPGQTIQVPYYKLVYEGDAKAGGINSYGHANAFNGDPALPESLVSGRSTDVFVPCGMGDGTPSVYYLKIVANAPANGLYFTEGETIKYRLSFGNNTKKDIYNITLNDPMANTRSVAFARRLKPGEFLMGEFEYIVTAADVAAGQIVNTATSTWATKAEGAQTKTLSNTVVTPCGSGVPSTGSIDAMLEKYVKNEPANGKYFVPGETIEYAVIFMNTCPHELHDVEVYDPLKGGNEDITIDREPIVAPNGTLYLSFNYTVTEEDAARGTVVNTASALWLNPETEEWSSCDSNTVTTLVGPAVSNDVAIIKTIENAPANGVYFVPGEVIQFAVTVQNNSAKTLDVVVLTDPLSADFFHELLDIPGGAMDSRTLNYTVTEFDAELGSVINYAYAVAYVDGNPTSLISNTASAPCGFPDNDSDGQPDDPFGVCTALEVVKSVESLPLNGSYYQKGETVSYKITYVNAGEVALTDVCIYDSLSGLSEVASAELLHPGESRSCFFSYTVTDFDVFWGNISNTAIGQYFINSQLNSVNSNTVVVDTNGREDIWYVHPYYPEDIIEGVIPPTGSIDQDKLPAGADYCKPIITARSNASASYDICYCSVHSPIQASLLMLKQTAVSPEMQQQTAAYAAAMWRAEVEKISQELFQAADPTAKLNVMLEYTSFLTEAANYEAVLKALHPDQPALVAQKIADMWEDKCVTLCYEIHASAAERTDSLLSIAASTGASAAECTCTVTAEQSGKKSVLTAYCPLHALPFSLTDTVLAGQDTAAAWITVRQAWTLELNKAYNLLCVKLGDKAALAMAERAVLTQWLAAREAALTALYPENPEVVAQTMVKLIMDRVNDLCQLVK